MVLLKVIKAKHLGSYNIELAFNNGVLGEVDLKEKIFSDHRAIFKPLQKVDFFKTFSLNRWTIEWENGLDMAPEFLFDFLKNQNINVSNSIEV